jgi:hypothetical protein
MRYTNCYVRPPLVHRQSCVTLFVLFSTLFLLPRAAIAGICCPKCSAICELSVDEGERSRHCWKIECEDVCVPRIVFPWQNRGKHRGSGCTGCSATGCTSCTPDRCSACVKHNGAFVIKVRKLKKHKYTCSQCEYTWEAKRLGCTESCSTWFDDLTDTPNASGEEITHD